MIPREMWSDEDSGGDDFDWESTEEGSYNADVQIDDAWINALLLDDNSSENDSTTTSSSQQASAPGRTMLGPMMVEPMIIHPQQEQQQKPEEPQKTANTEHKRPRQSYVSKQLPPQPKRKARGVSSPPPSNPSPPPHTRLKPGYLTLSKAHHPSLLSPTMAERWSCPD